jgi:Uma2 family endonuclease
MSTRSVDYRDAVDHLPNGASLVFQDVSWEDYEALVEDLWDRPGLRVTYDEGRLEIMSPLPEHEEYKEFIARMVYLMSDELDVNVEPRGSATWKRKKLKKGTEPDTCFYVAANADAIIGRRKIDLEFPVHAALGVPEIWLYNSRQTRAFIYELCDHSYVEIACSRFFPILASSALADFIEQSKTQGHKAVLSAFRKWINRRQKKA